MPLHHVKSHYNLILYYTSTYVERVGVSQHDNACSFIIDKTKVLFGRDIMVVGFTTYAIIAYHH
jgi:hypothetical protein